MFDGKLAAAPDRNGQPPDGGPARRPGGDGPARGGGGKGGRQYSLEQALSDQAQLHTIAFSGLAFITGDFGASTFIPPGKVADFFGFQYMRDIDAAGKGHNPMFLDRIVGNVLAILDAKQRATFERAAREQEALVTEIARKRFPLVAAFHRELSGDIPAGSAGLDRKAVTAYAGELFALDAKLAWSRAKAFGDVAGSLTAQQRQALGKLKFGDFASWQAIDRDEVRKVLPRGATKPVAVGYMTLASEFFSWYAGSVEADTYFCPERHGTYFGGFHMKDMPAMGKKDSDISTSLTGDAGAAFLEALDASQRARLTGILERQRPALRGIVEVRREISEKLRGFLKGAGPSEKEVVALGRRYGALDGELAYEYATAFAAIGKSLTPAQKERIAKLRPQPANESGNAFIYSDRVRLERVPETAFLFGK
jgi:Spy/CpxP family protein refolding chaperone